MLLTTGRTVSRTLVLALAAGGVLGGAACVLADEDSQKLRDRKPAFIGPIVRNPTGTLDGPFAAQNVILRSWIPLSNFPGFSGASQHSGADCWGYTSPSGREYALIGLGWGTGVVEITN